MKKIILSLAALFCCVSIFAQSVAPFKDGDRAVFLGNSITDGGHYHSYIWLYYMTRFPEMNLRVINAGIGGDTAADMFKRLDGDVFDKRPTVLSVTFGMNDTGYFEYNGEGGKEFGEQRYKQCYDNFKKLEGRFKTLTGVRVVMMGGSPYDQTAKFGGEPFRGKNDVMQRVSAFQLDAAKANGWEFIDLNAPMCEINAREQLKDESFTLCGGDRIHPDNAGHMVMAYLYLKAQGFEGKEVATIDVDGSKAKLTKASNCQITAIARNGRDLSFDYTAQALPYPLDTMARGWGAKLSQAKANDYVPFIDQMNREMLRVTGLKGNYTLFIDDEQIATLSSSELSAGVNLAKFDNTPQYRQAMAIMHLNEERWEIERQFRDFAWTQFNFFQSRGLLFANDTKALAELDKEKHNNGWLMGHRDNYARLMLPEVYRSRTEQMEQITERIYKINKPQTRKITLRSVR